jgi:predicted oxidoreductase
VTLAPLASVRYVIGEGDKAGGFGANFIVTWSAGEPVVEPVVESVMIGAYTRQGISFTSRARVIKMLVDEVSPLQ